MEESILEDIGLITLILSVSPLISAMSFAKVTWRAAVQGY